MNKAILCIGIDAFDKGDITPLNGAANDARRWAAFFEHRLGFVARVLTHEDLRAGARIFDVVDELLAHAGEPGDQFGVFIATHGKQMKLPGGGHDQVFLLPHARLNSIEAGMPGDGALSLRQLALESARPGLARFFMIDACRAPLKQAEATAPRDARVPFGAEGQVVYRDVVLRAVRQGQGDSPLLVFNACADQQRAAELRSQRRGLFSAAAESLAAERLQAGQPLNLDAAFAATVGERMRQLALQHQEELVQDPVIDQGGALCLWEPRSPATAHRAKSAASSGASADALGALLNRFEQQLLAGRLSSPPWDSCTGTLALLHEAGLSGQMLALLQGQVEAARQAHSPVAAPAAARARSQATPLAQMPAGHVFRDADWSPQMVVIPAGVFVMGSPEDEEGRFDDEGPQRQVRITQPFAMGRTVVTFDDYDRYARQAGIELPEDEGWGRGQRPVINVSWEDAQGYMAWLNTKLGLSPRSGYRLPSEAEWEYSARAGSTAAFWWGPEISTRQANYDGNYTYGQGTKGEFREQTVAADSFAPNPWGLYQVHGNVQEWVQDWYHDSYEGAPSTGLAWEEGSDKSRVLRGGYWDSGPRDLRAAYRSFDTPGYGVFAGFRIARTL